MMKIYQNIIWKVMRCQFRNIRTILLLFVCLFICLLLFVYLFVYLFVCLFVYLFVV